MPTPASHPVFTVDVQRCTGNVFVLHCHGRLVAGATKRPLRRCHPAHSPDQAHRPRSLRPSAHRQHGPRRSGPPLRLRQGRGLQPGTDAPQQADQPSARPHQPLPGLYRHRRKRNQIHVILPDSSLCSGATTESYQLVGMHGATPRLVRRRPSREASRTVRSTTSRLGQAPLPRWDRPSESQSVRSGESDPAVADRPRPGSRSAVALPAPAQSFGRYPRR